jgi:hypothetical protein
MASFPFDRREEKMSHIYDVQTSDGRSHQVATQHHHDDHDDASFKRHLLDVLKGSASGVIGGSVVHFLYRGRR